MKCIVYIYIFLIFCFLIITPSWADITNPPLIIGLDQDYPPFSHIVDGQAIGFNVDLAHAICTTIQRKCEIKILPMPQIYELMQQNKIHLMFGINKTSTLQQFMDFSDPYLHSSIRYIGNLKTVSDPYKSLIIGVRPNSEQIEYVSKRWTQFSKVVVDNFVSLMKKLDNEEIDLILDGNLAGYYFLSTRHGKDFGFLSLPLHEDILTCAIHVGVKKGNYPLVKDINKAILELKLNGSYIYISRKYFPYVLY